MTSEAFGCRFCRGWVLRYGEVSRQSGGFWSWSWSEVDVVMLKSGRCAKLQRFVEEVLQEELQQPGLTLSLLFYFDSLWFCVATFCPSCLPVHSLLLSFTKQKLHQTDRYTRCMFNRSSLLCFLWVFVKGIFLALGLLTCQKRRSSIVSASGGISPVSRGGLGDSRSSCCFWCWTHTLK